MRSLYLLATLLLNQRAAIALSLSTTELVEQLFLDFTIDEVVQNDTREFPIVEPWASEYVNATQEGRFGDAVWARYHISGDVDSSTGIIEGTNLTVLQSIEEDALGYRSSEPELYANALLFYGNTSKTDSHTDIIDLFTTIAQQTPEEAQESLNKRVTYGIKCSTGNLAYKSSCLSLLQNMSQSRSNIGNIRRIYTYSSCNLRVGPYHGSYTDLSYYTAHSVARLIEDQCTYCPACTNNLRVSGYSPKNSGHRKVCLSSKRTGCSP
ncbi:hypothetical protein CBS147325_6201 [Penicillium roqueforti]|nr:hypothetical protein CBS147325_6201 [Penicillium roqueforti]